MALGDGQVMDRVRSFLTEPTFANVAGMAPEDVARRRALAEALWAQGNSSRPVVGVFDGMNRVLQSFLGGRQLRQSENADIAIRSREAARIEQQQTDAIRQMNNFANPAQPAPMAPADTILPATTFSPGTQNEWSAGDFPGGETVPRGPTISYNYGDSTVRNQPINSNLENVLKAAAAAAGVSSIVIGSGGQPTAAEGGARAGSTRHDDGNAADLQLLAADGRMLDFTNPADVPIIQAFVSHARANGATGIGAGTDYMGNNTLHVGFGNEGVWGAGGQGANAPEWLTTAFNTMVPGTNSMRNFVDTAASNPVLRPFVAELLQGEIARLSTPPAPVEYGFMNAGDGNIYATNPAAGTATLAAGPGGAVAEREIRNDQNGVPRYVDTGEPVYPGVDAAPTPINFGDEESLRDNFRMETSDYRLVQGHFQRLQAAAANPSAAGDVAMVFAFMKMLDPGSVVRETEYATAQNAAGVPTIIQNMWNRVLSGERLAPEQRADFLGQAQSLFSATEQQYTATEQRFRSIAEQYGMDPNRIFGDDPLAAGGQPAAAAVPEAPTTPTPGTVMDGYRFNGGDPADQRNWTPVQ